MKHLDREKVDMVPILERSRQAWKIRHEQNNKIPAYAVAKRNTQKVVDKIRVHEKSKTVNVDMKDPKFLTYDVTERSIPTMKKVDKVPVRK